MKKRIRLLVMLTLTVLVAGLALVLRLGRVGASGTFMPIMVTDQTSAEPLANPDPNFYGSRYVSGFGSDGAFTVFFEDRDNAQTISYISTTTGPTGFGTSVTATNIADTHFVIKDWPVTISPTTYAYRAWGSVGNNPDHHFYVSDNLITWTRVSTFTIPNAPGFTNAKGWVYYGFHDVIQLNGTYYAFGESNQSQTMIVSSTAGTDDWVAFASLGGPEALDGPLGLPSGVANGWTPSGSFFDLGHDQGYGKIHIDPRDSDLYLAINTAAKASLPPAELEAAFVNPANWTWHDGTTGPAANPILSETGEHDLRECWQVPSTNPDAGRVIIYDADFGAGDGGKSLGYAILQPPPDPVYVDDDWDGLPDGTVVTPAGGITATMGYDAFAIIQDGVNGVASGSTVIVGAGTYTENIDIDKRITLQGSGSSGDPSSATIVEAANAGDPVIQIQADGTSASDRLTIKALRVTGATGSGNPGSGIEFDWMGSFVTIENVTAVGNGGHGIAIDATGAMQDIQVLNSTLSNNGGSGFRVPSSLGSLSGLAITGSQIYSNTSIGLLVYGTDERNVSVSDTWFADNATNQGTGGDIVLTSFITGSASFSNVAITSNNADAGIRISGSSSSPSAVPPITLSDVTIEGTQRGAALAISRYTDGSNISFSNVTLNSSAPSGLHLGSLSGSLDTGDTRFSGGYSMAGSAPAFAVPNPGAIVLGKHRGMSGSDATISVDATYNDWGIADLAAIEDKIYHQVDDSALGEVLYYGITLSDDGSSPMLDGASYATITATLTGLLDPAGNVISFTTDLGTLGTITGTADASGTVTTIITSAVSGTATIAGTAGMKGPNPKSDATQITFVPLTLDHFHIGLIPNQMAGVGFPVAISARDASDILIDFNGWATLTDTTTTLVPTNPIQFRNGTWSGVVTVAQVYAGDVIVVTYVHDAGRYGSSNAFDVDPLQYFTYLPSVQRNYVQASDLVVDSIIATTDKAQVVIKNEGNAPVNDEFWVQAYIDPHLAPTTVNQLWYDLGDQGMFWGVLSDTLPLAPGGTITLTYKGVYYWPSISRFYELLPPGMLVYAQVDAWHAATTYGAVLESHEIRGEAYNNISSTVSTLSAADAIDLRGLR